MCRLALLIFSCFALLFTALALPVGATGENGDIAPTLPRPTTPAPATSAASFVLLEGNGGGVLAEKEADVRRPMASTTKIMTALVVLESLPLDTVVTVPPEAVGTEGSSVYLFAGERITVETLLYALLLSSANDAAVALAIATSGSVTAFADRMNQKATELGLSDTHFSNPHGLHEKEHYTTARDLARLTLAALKNSTLSHIVSTRRHTVPQNGTDATRLFLNHNRLLRTFEGAVGVKTGFTRVAGRCLVSAAQRGGLLLIAVTLSAPNDWRDHTALLEWGFSEYEAFAPTPSPLTVPVVGGSTTTVTLAPEIPPAITLPRGHGKITAVVEAPRFLFGGFEAGEVKGRILYYMDGTPILSVPLSTTTASLCERPTRWWHFRWLF